MINKIKSIYLFFLLCFLLSFFFLFLFILKWPIQPKIDEILYSSLTPFYQSFFSTVTNDFSYYIFGILIFLLTPFVIFLLWKYLRFYTLIVLGLILIFFHSQVFELILFYNNVLNYQRLFYLLVLSSITTVLLKFKLNLSFKKLKLSKIFYLVFFLFIFFLIYNPKYKFSFDSLAKYGYESYYQFHHLNFFIGPINEILHGKSLLVNASSQYGILMTYFIALFFKIFGASYSNFVLYNILLTFIYLCFFFFAIKKLTKSTLISIIGILSYVALVFFRYDDPSWEVFILASTTPLRFFFDIPVIIFLIDSLKTKSIKSNLIVTIMIAIALFYNLEFGLPLVTAYLLTIIVDWLITKKNNHFFFSFLNLAASITGLVLMVSIFSLIRSGALPDWPKYIFYVLFYSKGFLDVPMQPVDFYYFPLFIYAISYFYLLAKIYYKNYQKVPIIFFLLIYGLMIFFYYLNLSEPNHLLTVIHPAILLFLLYLSYFKEKLRLFRRVSPIWLFITIFFFIMVFDGIFNIPEGKKDRYLNQLKYRYSPIKDKYYHWEYSGTDFFLKDNDGKDFYLAAQAIKKFSGQNKEVIILSRYDTLLYLMSQKSSRLGYPIIEYEPRTEREVAEIISNIDKIRPKYIFVSSDKYSSQEQTENIKIIWEGIRQNYSLVQKAGAVDVYGL